LRVGLFRRGAPISVTVDDKVSLANAERHGTGYGLLLGIAITDVAGGLGAAEVGVKEYVVVDLYAVQVGLQKGEARCVPVTTDTVQLVLGAGAAVAFFIGKGRQYIFNRAKRQALASQPNAADPWENDVIEAVVLGGRDGEYVVAAILLVVGIDVIVEGKDVTPAPATGVLEGEGALLFLLFCVEVQLIEAAAVQVGDAVVLKVQQVAGEYLSADGQTAGEQQVWKNTLHGYRLHYFYGSSRCG
jgi:hypothetical protein